tara:strand:+ start:28506 stop:29726 length:1221 start_codon:yes stop_codon:yes gene_type:complete
MDIVKRPALWMVGMIMLLPQIGETIYSPSLPHVAEALNTSDNAVEYTLTIYLLAFALGLLFWGNLSDRFGRKPIIVGGFSIFFLGTLGCWQAQSITSLMIFRFIQALGGSVGTISWQSIVRDSFSGKDLAKVFSVMTVAFSLSPGLGPFIGGFTDEYFGWRAVFLLLMIFTAVSLYTFIKYLPETHTKRRTPEGHTSFRKGAKIILRDVRGLALGFLIGTASGIMFSYYAEGPFYFIEMLGLSPSFYGTLALLFAIPVIVGGWASRRLHAFNIHYESIILLGCLILFGASLFLSGLAYYGYVDRAHGLLITITVIMIIATLFFAISMILPNCLSAALEDYGHMVGTAASLFGCLYYSVIAGTTFVMGSLHNDTTLPMPLLFTAVSLIMIAVFFVFVRSKKPKPLAL